MELEYIQQALQAEQLDDWLFYDLRKIHESRNEIRAAHHKSKESKQVTMGILAKEILAGQDLIDGTTYITDPPHSFPQKMSNEAR